ncbi:MAG TPA: hypothetical protein VGI69_04780 [Gaiellaceae bacterium]
MTNWLKRLFGGGSDEPATTEAAAPEPATAPEPSVTPAEPPAPSAPPAPAPPETSGEAPSDTGDAPA